MTASPVLSHALLLGQTVTFNGQQFKVIEMIYQSNSASKIAVYKIASTENPQKIYALKVEKAPIHSEDDFKNMNAKFHESLNKIANKTHSNKRIIFFPIFFSQVGNTIFTVLPLSELKKASLTTSSKTKSQQKNLNSEYSQILEQSLLIHKHILEELYVLAKIGLTYTDLKLSNVGFRSNYNRYGLIDLNSIYDLSHSYHLITQITSGYAPPETVYFDQATKTYSLGYITHYSTLYALGVTLLEHVSSQEYSDYMTIYKKGELTQDYIDQMLTRLSVQLLESTLPTELKKQMTGLLDLMDGYLSLSLTVRRAKLKKIQSSPQMKRYLEIIDANTVENQPDIANRYNIKSKITIQLSCHALF